MQPPPSHAHARMNRLHLEAPLPTALPGLVLSKRVAIPISGLYYYKIRPAPHIHITLLSPFGLPGNEHFWNAVLVLETRPVAPCHA